MISFINEDGEYIETMTPVDAVPEGWKHVPQREAHWFNWNTEAEQWDYDKVEHDTFESTNARSERSRLLRTVVDPLVTNPLRWAELTAEKQAEWTQFRRDLLDVTEQEGFPHEVVWPTKPE